MRLPFGRVLRAALAAAGLSGILYTGYLFWRGELMPDPEQPFTLVLSSRALESLGLVMGLTVLAGLFGAWQARVHYRQLLRSVADEVQALRRDPSPHALERHSSADFTPDLRPLQEELGAFADCYRKALGEVVQKQEELESLRGPDARESPGGADRAGTQAISTRYLLGSSRHRMVARLAPNLHWMAATPPLQQFLGAPIQQLTARSFLEHVHPEDAPALQRTFQEAAREGEGHNITFRVLVPGSKETSAPGEDGLPRDTRHLQMDVMTCYTEAGAPLHLRCHFVDITDRIRTDQELRRRTEELSQANARLRQINADLQRLKESYRDLYHHSPVLYFSLDASGNFVALNETMLRTLGYPRDALLGQHYPRLLAPAARDAFLQDPTVFQRAGELETQWVQQDGTVIDVWIATTTIRDEQGNFVRSRSVARDITERNRLANALRAKADELQQANAQLRRINQELEDFTYVVSHDLKEPLRTLQAFSNFLLLDYGDKLGEEGHEYINHLIEASKRLGMLIDDLLTLSRAGRVIHTPHAFSWDAALRTVRGDLQDLLGRQQAALRVEGPLPPAAGDPERIVQLLTNLVSNGLKYNRSPRPEIVIGALPADLAATNRSDGADFVTLFVRDNGIGIEPQYHEQIFRMFRRLHRRDEFEGTGAGLAICKKIVEAHGGRIWIDSAPGQGTTCYFTLPRLQAPRKSNTVLLPPSASGAYLEERTPVPVG